jgi:hypothetical protein
MPILIKNRVQYSQILVDKMAQKLDQLQNEVVDGIKVSLQALVSIEVLYDIRDYIDQLILNWEDEEIELEDEDLDDDE